MVHRVQCFGAGEDLTYMYLPNSSPIQPSKVDPAYLVQVQFQMHATGASMAFIASWARTGVSVHRIQYSFAFVEKAAAVAAAVITHYVLPDERPALPKSLASMDDQLKQSWIEMYDALRDVAKQAEWIPQPPGAHTQHRLRNTACSACTAMRNGCKFVHS